ncbi:MAG: Hsp70 family protein [Deltaproteobacteria bacterium]|nr:Hsp70 family protein [Deltaproteobacteria bacterium]
MANQSRRIYGIDLGTTYSSIAYADANGKPVVLPNSEQSAVTPSVVLFADGRILVGNAAKKRAWLHPDSVASFIKRSVGEKDFLFFVGDRSYHAEEISAYILRKLVQDAGRVTGDTVRDVVITCPAYFGVNEREATRRAGEIAGLNVRRIINEPTAAAIAYGSAKPGKQRTILVYDLGGGTFDITMIQVQNEVIEVICTGGDHNLGGKDWDDRIVTYLAEEYQNQTGTTEDILEDPKVWQALQYLAEQAKKLLTKKESVDLPIKYAGKSATITLTRDKFDSLTSDLLERTVSLVHSMLAEAAKKGCGDFDEFILVGGSTRMIQVPKRLYEEFQKRPMSFEPEKAVAKGAAILGHRIATGDSTASFTEVAGENVGVSGAGGARSAQKQARIRDVAAKSFGILLKEDGDDEDVFNVILRNSPIPVRAKETFYTQAANQEGVKIRVVESETSDEWVSCVGVVEIGTAWLKLPPNLPAETPVVITFELSEEGRLSISAEESATGQIVDVTIESAAVIGGTEFEEAKARGSSVVVE